jgi:hypothetical protein
LRGGTEEELPNEEVLNWAVEVVKVAMEYYDAEVENCLDPDCEVCESMQKLGRVLGGNVKLTSAYRDHDSWLASKKQRDKRLGIREGK